jgi:transposase
VDRGRAGSKQHLLVDESGLPLAFAVTGSQRNDVTQLIPLLDAAGGRGPARPAATAARELARRPRLRPRQIPPARLGTRDQARDRPPTRPSTALGSGRYRWVVERTFAWLRHFKRLLSAHSESSS